MKGKAKAITCILAATAVWAGGCARLVVLNPEVAASRNDGAWKTGRRAPQVAPAPVQAPVAAPVTTDPVIVPLPPATEAAPAAAPPVPAPAPVPPVIPFRERPEVQQAMATPADGNGVPAGLYLVDPLLAAHRGEMDRQARSRRNVGIGTVVLGLVFGGLTVLGFSLAADGADSSNQMTRDSATRLYIWSSLLGVIAFGDIVAGTALMFTSSDSTQLRTYYRDTYSAKP